MVKKLKAPTNCWCFFIVKNNLYSIFSSYFCIVNNSAMNKTIFLCITIILLTNNLFSQNDLVYNSKLFVKFTSEELKNIENNHPDSVLFLNYIASKGYSIIDMPPKQIQCGVIENVSEEDLKDFNVFEYNVQFLENKNNYYKLGNTGKLLILTNLRDIKQFSKQEKQKAK